MSSSWQTTRHQASPYPGAFSEQGLTATPSLPPTSTPTTRGHSRDPIITPMGSSAMPPASGAPIRFGTLDFVVTTSASPLGQARLRPPLRRTPLVPRNTSSPLSRLSFQGSWAPARLKNVFATSPFPPPTSCCGALEEPLSGPTSRLATPRCTPTSSPVCRFLDSLRVAGSRTQSPRR